MNKTKRVKSKHVKSKIWKQHGCSNRKKNVKDPKSIVLIQKQGVSNLLEVVVVIP